MRCVVNYLTGSDEVTLQRKMVTIKRLMIIHLEAMSHQLWYLLFLYFYDNDIAMI